MTDKSRIYMDSCCFIDMAKQAAKILPSGRGNEVWYIKKLLEARKDGHIEVYTSVLSIAECTHADQNVSHAVRDIFTRLLTSGQYVTLVQPTPFIAIEGRDLRWNHSINLRGADCIHVASAISVKCSEFLTTDSGIKGYATKLMRLGLRVVEAEKTTLLPSQYRQESMLDDKIAPLKRSTPKH